MLAEAPASEERARLPAVPRSMSVNSPPLTDTRLSSLTEKLYPIQVICRIDRSFDIDWISVRLTSPISSVEFL